MYKLLISVIVIFIISGCSTEKIEITADYIINPNWDEQANAIKINKVKLKKDSTINPFSELIQEEILNKLEEDSTYIYYANAKIKQGESYKNKKIYFGKDNGFTWLNDNTEIRTRVLGNLQPKTWYKFSHLLTYPYYIYVYIDSINKAHRFDVNLANY